MGTNTGKPKSRDTLGEAGPNISPFDGFISETQRHLLALEAEYSFAANEVDIHPPECTLTYKRPDLWVRITYEYPGVPFCTLRLIRDDGRMAWVAFDVVADRLSLASWSTPREPVSFFEAGSTVETNARALLDVVDAVARVDTEELFHDQLWRAHS